MMKLLDITKLVCVSSFPKKYAEHVARARYEDVVFLKRNRPWVVLVDFRRWRKLCELEDGIQEKKALKKIHLGAQKMEKGLFKELQSLADL